MPDFQALKRYNLKYSLSAWYLVCCIQYKFAEISLHFLMFWYDFCVWRGGGIMWKIMEEKGRKHPEKINAPCMIAYLIFEQATEI